MGADTDWEARVVCDDACLQEQRPRSISNQMEPWPLGLTACMTLLHNGTKSSHREFADSHLHDGLEVGFLPPPALECGVQWQVRRLLLQQMRRPAAGRRVPARGAGAAPGRCRFENGGSVCPKLWMSAMQALKTSACHASRQE